MYQFYKCENTTFVLSKYQTQVREVQFSEGTETNICCFSIFDCFVSQVVFDQHKTRELEEHKGYDVIFLGDKISAFKDSFAKV